MEYDGFDTIRSTILQKCPCREKEIDTLLKYISPKKSPISLNSLFVYGNTSTGKSYVIKTILNELQVSIISYCLWFLSNADFEYSIIDFWYSIYRLDSIRSIFSALAINPFILFLILFTLKITLDLRWLLIMFGLYSSPLIKSGP